MIRSALLYLFRLLIVIHHGSAVVKFKGLIVLAAPIAFSAFLSPISQWINSNSAYIGFVLIAIAIDHLLGSAVHLFVEKDFTFKKNILGLAVKLSLVLAAGVLFEGFQYLYPYKTPLIKVVLDYLLAITRIMVFLYPAGSAFVNSSILSGGKIPPKGWIDTIASFNNSLDINKLKGHGKNEDTRESE